MPRTGGRNGKYNHVVHHRPITADGNILLGYMVDRAYRVGIHSDNETDRHEEIKREDAMKPRGRHPPVRAET